MQEISLNFDRNTDNTIVKLSKNNVKKVGNAIKSVYDIVNDIDTKTVLRKIKIDLINGNSTDYTLVKEIEKHLDIVFKAFKYDDFIKREKEKKADDIEERKQQNEELKSMLDLPISNEDIREKMKNVKWSIYSWWKRNGFGHISDVSFLENRIEVKLSGLIFDGEDDKGNKIPEKERKTYFESLGFSLDDNYMVLSDNNLKLLSNLIDSKFPKHYIKNIENFWGSRKDYMAAQEIVICIPYTDIKEDVVNKSDDFDPIVFENFQLRNLKDEEKVDKSISELKTGISLLVERYNNGELESGFSETILGCIEGYALSLFDVLKYKGSFTKRREELYLEIRTLNHENRRLREQLGNKANISTIGDRIKTMKNNIEYWWGIDGLGYTRDIVFHEYGVKVKLSCNISDYHDYDKNSKNAIKYLSSKDRASKLESHMLDLNMDNKEFLDTEKNRNYIKNLIEKRFGYSATFSSVDSDFSKIKEININVSNLDVI